MGCTHRRASALHTAAHTRTVERRQCRTINPRAAHHDCSTGRHTAVTTPARTSARGATTSFASSARTHTISRGLQLQPAHGVYGARARTDERRHGPKRPVQETITHADCRGRRSSKARRWSRQWELRSHFARHTRNHPARDARRVRTRHARNRRTRHAARGPCHAYKRCRAEVARMSSGWGGLFRLWLLMISVFDSNALELPRALIQYRIVHSRCRL